MKKKKNNKKLNPRVYLEAAKLIERERYACHAVESASEKLSTDESKYTFLLEKIFFPENGGMAWFTEDDETAIDGSIGLIRREIALLLMYEMAKGGDL